ncbi:hypothetical protein QJS10_CPB12g00923 [Acorus calamus]|uniref:Uncharacterized protein n=1 Tax=Acorus calamus TaxID=4465 RepID=A0AAV9DNX0_ACOCL|nr:hypothetical protein QJS10_CPB12g00923 [Acorus calamus]
MSLTSRHTVFEGDESPSHAQNDSPEEQNGFFLRQSRHDSSESEGYSEEKQETNSLNSDSYVYLNLRKQEVYLNGPSSGSHTSIRKKPARRGSIT